MMLKHYFNSSGGGLVLLLAMPLPAHATFGGGDVVFDPTMYASQLQQLQQETATVTNLAQQLQYAIKNTTGGGAGVWQSNQNLLANLGGLISEQQGLSYTFQGLAQQFQQLYPGYNVTSYARRAKPAGERRHHAQHPERRAPERPVAGPEFSGRAGRAAKPRGEESDRGRQPAGGSGEQRNRARPGPADPAAAPARDGADEFAEHRGGEPAQQPDPKPARGAGVFRGAGTFRHAGHFQTPRHRHHSHKIREEQVSL